MAHKVACIGECMIEMVLPDAQGAGARVGFAGDTFNAAVYLKRAAPTCEVAYVTALGTDAASGRMIAAFEAEGLDTSLIERRADRMPGCYAITVTEQGERSFLYWRSESAARTLFLPPARVLPEHLDGFDLVYLSGISLAVLAPQARRALHAWLTGYRARGGQVAFDSNYRPTLWSDEQTARREIGAFWEICDIALPSIDDEMALFGDDSAEAVIARLRAADVRRGALKRGALGPLSLGQDVPVEGFAPAERVIDTTAAGDSFNGAYLAAALGGGGSADCLRAGHDMARRVVAHPGAILPA